ITEDFGTMSRHEGDPVPHEHQFYRTTLKGLFSLDLAACGSFSYRQKTGYLNLDEERINLAVEKGLEPKGEEKLYRLPVQDRIQRITALFEGMAHLEGGAKQALHYTDVAPALAIMAVTKGGNHIFGHVIGVTGRGQPEIKLEAFREALSVFADDLLSDVYLGWTAGYLDDERARFESALADGGLLSEFAGRIHISHPRDAYLALVADLKKTKNSGWLD
ncbi:MAG: type I-B CRISPR-associated protein Cas7/Cst2/DevR, partial [Anaerolineales bacterium]|nr:type I-B CRISPR-associated protein Cas7/Cst2/DevR [Anaerolineales bacterium]